MKKTIIFLSTITFIYAQDLKTTLVEVINTNPSIKERLKNYNATKEDINIAKSRYYPKLDLNLGAGYESTTRTDIDGNYQNTSRNIPIKNLGYHVYQNSLTYTHNIFEGFGTKYSVLEEKYKTVSAAYSYIEEVNAKSIETVNAYMDYLKNKELLKTAQDNVTIDEKILEKVRKLYDSGLSTLSEVNKIESSLALAKSNLVVQENRLLDSSYYLEKVLGRHLTKNELEKIDIKINLPKTKEEAIEMAYLNNPSLLITDFNIKLAEATYHKAMAPFYPKVDVLLSANYNKNLSAIAGNNDAYKGMVYLTYNIFNGFSDQASKQKSISRIHQEYEAKNKLKRDIISNINLGYGAKEKLSKQLEHLNQYKNFSLKTLKLYAKEYDLGRRSLLDLLTAQNDYINSKAQIISVEYDILRAKFRILDAMGTLVQTIMEDTTNIYSKVNLAKIDTSKKDTLPLVYDTDKDIIVDSKDICSNSKLSDVQNIYGCNDNTKASVIDRYSWFLYDDSPNYLFTDSINDDCINNLKDFIKNTSKSDWKNVKIDIFGNAFEDDKSKQELYKISKKRAEFVRDMFIKAGAKKENISLHVNGDEAPLFGQNNYKNNRVDIIIKKMEK